MPRRRSSSKGTSVPRVLALIWYSNPNPIDNIQGHHLNDISFYARFEHIYPGFFAMTNPSTQQAYLFKQQTPYPNNVVSVTLEAAG